MAFVSLRRLDKRGEKFSKVWVGKGKKIQFEFLQLHALWSSFFLLSQQAFESHCGLSSRHFYSFESYLTILRFIPTERTHLIMRIWSSKFYLLMKYFSYLKQDLVEYLQCKQKRISAKKRNSPRYILLHLHDTRNMKEFSYGNITCIWIDINIC